MNTSENLPGKGITLTEKEIRKLNDSHTARGGKWIGMFKGIRSEVTSVKNGLITFEIIYPDTQKADPDEAGLLLRLLLGCREFPDLKAITGLILREYTASGRAGYFGPVDSESESQHEFQLIMTGKFGEDKQEIRSHTYTGEELHTIKHSPA